MSRPAPDPGWLPFIKLAFGFMLLIVTATLAVVIALGKVEAQTSHGLDQILGSLATLSGGFTIYAFTSNIPKPKPPEQERDGKIET